ncbi:flavin reductase family protein [Mycobacterium sp. DL440]|uniref:flavin reductase family protein n=1 Tax=Mycobacterium sp. DL440 TaxID=2675523 RepID=UPI001421168C|nr:flavin reductase family protein [Mycobacterium sp. DL440]
MSQVETLSTDPTKLRSVLGCFPSGVVIVTGQTESECVGLTVQSFMALSLEPPLVLLSIARTSTSWPAIKANGRFGINVLGESAADLASEFARSGGPKFDSCEWHPGLMTGSPVLPGAIAWIEAEIWQLYDGGDHEIVAARVLDLGAVEGDSRPLLFFRSNFTRLAAG